jgi:glutathione transport system permease protein
VTGAALRRAGQALLTLLSAAVLVWALQGLAPGDPARRVLAARGVGHPNAAQIAEQRAELGLDDPAWLRFARWLTDALRGDLGESWVTGRPVSGELGARLPATLALASAALAIAVVLALALALTAAAAPGRWPDTVVRLLALSGLVLPSFVLASILINVVVLRWGHFQVVADGSWGTVFLPALVLAVGPAAVWSRVLRTALLDARGAGHGEVCLARGAGPARRLFVHDLPNALVPFLTVVGTGLAALLGGAPIVETVFTWPGIGRFAVASITARDLPVVQGFTLLAVLAFVVVSMLVDLAAMAIDPRTRPAGRERVRA